MTKHLEVKTYESYGIKVIVKIYYDKGLISLMERDPCHQLIFMPKKWVFAERDIDYDKGLISLMERDPCHQLIFMPKKWVFAERDLDYNGWENILNAMQYAIQEAKKELETYLKEQEKAKHDLVTDVLIKATEMVKNKNFKKVK